MRLTAGGNHFGLGAQLFHQALDHAVDQTQCAVVESGLHAAYGVCSDQLFRLAEIDTRQAGGAGIQGIDRDTDPGGAAVLSDSTE